MTTFASDAFTGTEDTTLSTYNASWSKITGATGSAEIASNRLRGSDTLVTAYYHSATPPSADYPVQAIIHAVSVATGGNAGVVGRASNSANTYYYARLNGTSGWQLFKRVAGTATQLGSSVAQTLTAGQSYAVELRMTGTTIELYKLGESTAAVSVTDSAITAAGFAGLYFFSNVVPSDAGNFHLDDWSAGTLGGSAVGVTSVPRWNALAYASKSSTVRWNAVVVAGNSQGVRWNALALAGQNSLLRWNSIAVAAKVSTPRWDALTTVNKASTPRWDALVTATKTQVVRWDMLSSVILAGTDVTLRWNSIGIAQKLATARWNSVIAVPKDTTPRWNALTTVSKSANTRWDLIAAVQKTVAPHWNMFAAAGMSGALRWNMTQAVAQAVAARWNLVSTVAAAQTVTLRWHSISVSGKNVVCRWQVGDTGNTHYSYIDVLVLPEENRVMVLSAPNNVITIH